MQRPGIAFKLEPRDYNGLVDLGNRVVSEMTGNSNFIAPMPALTTLQSAITATATAIANHGDVHSHGSTNDMLNLRASSLTLYQLLRAEADYVQCVAQIAAGSDYPAMATIISSSGFALRGAKNPQGLLQAVRNLHHFITRSLSANRAKLKWEKPENVTSKNNVRSYIVYRGTTPVFSAAVPIAHPSRAMYIDTNNTGAPVTYFYWVVAVGAAGYGAVSDVLMITMLAI